MKEAAEQIATTRTIRAGRDAWAAVGKAENFKSWQRIGAALAIGKAHALRVTGANAAWGRNYSREFCAFGLKVGMVGTAKFEASRARE